MALMPEVQFLLSDPELGAHAFDVTRKTYAWKYGKLVPQDGGAGVVTVHAVGVIVPPSPEELAFFPEGVRRENTRAIYTKTMLYVTEGEQISDTVTWRNDIYKVIRVDRWDDHGFCVAYAVKE